METLVCATHPARRASLTCERCGSYACSECAFDAPWGVSVCGPCKSRGWLAYPLAWQRGSMWNPLRFARSVRSVLTDAPTVFANMPQSGSGRVLGFCAWVAGCLALYSLLQEALGLRLNWHDARTLRALSVFGAAHLAEHVGRTLAVVLLSALAFHLIARAFGGAASPAVALRTAAYGSTFLLYSIAAGLASTLAPFLELSVIVIATLGQLYLYFVCLSITAAEAYGVSQQRADAIAAVTVALLVPTMVLAAALVAAIGMYGARFWAILPH